MMISNVSTDHFRGDSVSHNPDEIPITPKLSTPKMFLQPREFLKDYLGADTLQDLYHFGRRIFGWGREKDMDMIAHDLHRIDLSIILCSNLLKQLLYSLLQLLRQNLFAVFGNPNEMVLDIVDRMLCPFDCHAVILS